ncbi:DUF1192 domain-containing protein [Daeguia caeni]|uniref:DUF1192 domain-containing protein n=1 Tax=Daeguia caeni TaxID=439612 RepID=A0ABV9GZU7_9HYPH
MRDFDDDAAKQQKSLVLSDDALSLLSVTEIDQRIALLENEIARLQAERTRKGDSRAAAEALFR